MVEFDNLPEEDRLKDVLFTSVVRSLLDPYGVGEFDLDPGLKELLP